MTVYRPTALRMASRHCPRALDYYEQNRSYFRDHYAVGIAAHAVLEALGHHRAKLPLLAGTEMRPEVQRDIAEQVVRKLITTGRAFDGKPEPPLSPDAAFEGRDLALRWALANPLSPTASYELGAGFDRDWQPVGYDDPSARFRLIFDVLDTIEESDEESGSTGLLVRDYKTAWSTGQEELDSLQMKAQAVCAVALNCRSLTEMDYSFVKQEVVNLRTMQSFNRTIWIDGMGHSTEVDGVSLLAGWQRDLTMAMDALDEMRLDTWRCADCDNTGDRFYYDTNPDGLPPLATINGEPHRCLMGAVHTGEPGTERCQKCHGRNVTTGPSARLARPGMGCAGCPWVSSCQAAREFLDETKTPMHPEALSRLLAAAKASAEAIEEIARRVLDDHGHVDVDGFRVGTVATPRREPTDEAGIKLLERWQQQGGDVRGLMKALKPGVTAIEGAAKTLFPGKEQKLVREDLVASLTKTKMSARFGVHKLTGE